MSDAVSLALVAAIAPTLAATAAVIISLRNGRKADVTQAAVGAVDVKVEKVHEVANSNFSRVTAELQVANARIEGLERLLTAATKTAAAQGRKTPL